MFGYEAAEASFHCQENPVYLFEEQDQHPLVMWAEDHEVELALHQDAQDEFDQNCAELDARVEVPR